MPKKMYVFHAWGYHIYIYSILLTIVTPPNQNFTRFCNYNYNFSLGEMLERKVIENGLKLESIYYCRLLVKLLYYAKIIRSQLKPEQFYSIELSRREISQ